MTAVDDTETPAPTLGAPLSGPTANHTDVVSAARSYAELGWRVVPIKPGEKRPALNNWPNLATDDLERIDLWWTTSWLLAGEKVDGAACGVGIATGPDSDVFVLDVDVAGDKRGDQSLAQLEATHGPLPATVEAITPSGGRHLYFQWPLDTDVATNANRLGQHLDIRGHGGQVLAPPTAAPTVHPGAPPYRWADGHSPDDIAVADAPRWLLALLEPDEPAPTPTTPTLAPVAPDGELTPAEHFNATTTWAELLQRDGWTLAHTTRDGEQRWTRPGKNTRDGASATVGHRGRDCLKVFTSSVPQLTEGRAYSRFGYQAAMHHGGDRAALAREVRRIMPQHHDDLSWADAPAPPIGLDPTTGEVTGSADAAPIDHGWLPADMSVVLAEDYRNELPTLLERTDGRAVLYPERINALWGESGSGKTWLAQLAMAQVLIADGTVLDVDHEDTAAGAVGRLRALGVPDDRIAAGFIHIAPEQRWNDLAASMLHQLIEEHPVTLAVIDSTGEAMASDGVKPNDDDDVARWHQALPKFLTRRGVTVLLIDHVPKTTDGGGAKLHAIGSQRKRAAITGAAYMVEAAVSPARGVTGHLKIVCAKDRHGAFQRGQLVADATVTSNPTGDHVTIELAAHEVTTRPTVLMSRVSRYLEQLAPAMASKNQIEREVEGKATGIRLALSVLVDEGHVEMEMRTGRSGGSYFRSINPFHDTDDLSWAVDNHGTSSTSSQPRPNLVPSPQDDPNLTSSPSSPRPIQRTGGGTRLGVHHRDDTPSVDNSNPHDDLF